MIKPPRYTRTYIEQVAHSLVIEYIRLGRGAQLLKLGYSFEELFDSVIYPTYQIELIEDAPLGFAPGGGEILGAYDPEANRAFISPCLKNDPRRIFTCFHEVVGHGVLQGDWLREQSHILNLDAETIVTTEVSLLPSTVSALERQANFCAAATAAPRPLLWRFANRTFDCRGRPIRFGGREKRHCLHVHGKDIWYDDVESAFDLAKITASKIKHLFWGLSNECLAYRLLEAGIVKDEAKKRVVLYRLAG